MRHYENKPGHFRLIPLKITLEITIEVSRKATDAQAGASPLVARRKVTTRIPAP